MRCASVMASSVLTAQLVGIGVAGSGLATGTAGDGISVAAMLGSGVAGCSGRLTSGFSVGLARGTGHAEPPTNGVEAGSALSRVCWVATDVGTVPVLCEHAASATMSGSATVRRRCAMRPHNSSGGPGGARFAL